MYVLFQSTIASQLLRKFNSGRIRAWQNPPSFPLIGFIIDFTEQFYNPLNLIKGEWTLVAGQDSS